jgi:hypothetical protein
VSEDTSRVEEEVAAIFEALRSGVRARPPATLSPLGDDSLRELQARRELDRRWRVTAERPFLRRPGPLGSIYGALVLPFKWILRRLMRWYVEPMAADQRAFNAAVMRALDEQSERFEAELQRLERMLQDGKPEAPGR